MTAPKQKRLSSIFSLSSNDPRSGIPEDSTSSARRVSPPSSTRSRSPAAPPARLQKALPPNPNSARAPSDQFLSPAEVPNPSIQQLAQGYGAQDGPLGSPLAPPPKIGLDTYSRSSSPDRYGSRPQTPSSRPATPTLQTPTSAGAPGSPIIRAATGEDDKKAKKKHWWSSSKKNGNEERGPPAWIAGHPDRLPYDVNAMLSARQMPELWDESGDCFVYLYPRTSGKGASFRVDSSIFASSPELTRLAFGDLYSNPAVVTGDRRTVSLDVQAQGLSLRAPSTPPLTPKRNVASGTHYSNSSSGSRESRTMSSFEDRQESHLYLPLKLSTDSAIMSSGEPTPATEDVEQLVAIRNLFAFLSGQSLVATERRSTFFRIFMDIANWLKYFQFSNLDGSTFGEVATSSFDNYVEELGLADVRSSREKTIEGIVLGEHMRSVLLYNEAFTHGVGKFEDIQKYQDTPKFRLISPVTQNRLERAAMDLDKRTASIRHILQDFEFPSIFSGIMNSKTAEERKAGVRFGEWQDSFMATRKYVMGLYKHRYGSWPPKASSKKNNLETSGLNRLVLKDLYRDMSSMYDLLVDRQALTTRTVDGINLESARDEPTVRAMRAVLSEYDRSSPPVKPPIPFDLPLMPNLRSTRPDFGTGDKKKDLKAIQKKIKDDEIAQILKASYNQDAPVTPFVEAFRDHERRSAHGCTIAELVDLRMGQWIFMYVVLQALPMLAVDAPRISHSKGVEYFLCEPPRSGVPWAREDAASVKRNWYGIAGSGGVVSLPSDVVEHGVEGIYRRSHCWEMAEKWSAANPILNEALHEQEASGHINEETALPAVPAMPGTLRPSSRSSSPNRRSVMMSGLEALPLPAGVTPDGSAPVERPRSAHNVDASKTFDAILADTAQGKQKGKKK